MLTRRVLNRTLLARQHLLERTTMTPLAMVEHLVGLQAQEPLPPYLSLAARIEGFDPHPLSRALEERTAVRVLLMRGTIHLVTPGDALTLRRFVQPHLDKITRNSALSRPAAGVDRDRLAIVTREVFDRGPLNLSTLGDVLAEHFPGVPANALANTAREMLPLAQLPPRGQWKRPGGVVYQPLETWLGTGPDLREPVPADLVRRYLRAFGPATPADVTAWSGVTGMRDTFRAMADELAQLTDEDGRTVFDLAGLGLADADRPAPVRLLGRYDNVWLSHAGRDRVTAPEHRKRWMGSNGGVGNTVFVDGMLEGLWRQTRAGRIDVEVFRALTKAERADLEQEVARTEALLDVPA